MPGDAFASYRTTHDDGARGVQHVYRFPNGRTASVIRRPTSYGGDRGLWELDETPRHHATLRYPNPSGWLTWAQVQTRLRAIKRKPTVQSALRRE